LEREKSLKVNDEFKFSPNGWVQHDDERQCSNIHNSKPNKMHLKIDLIVFKYNKQDKECTTL